MSASAGATPPEGETLLDLFHTRAESGGEQLVQYNAGGAWRLQSWSDAYQRAEAVARGLVGLGVRRGDRIGILSSTRVEWMLAELATWMTGAVTVPLYSFTSAEDCRQVLRAATVSLVFAENEAQHAKLSSLGEGGGTSPTVVLLDGDAARAGARSWAELEGSAPSAAAATELAARRTALRPSDPATIAFRVARGRPVGFLLRHETLRAQSVAISQVLGIGADDVQLVHLPLAHLLPRVVCLAALHGGGRIVFGRSLEQLQEDIAEVGPTYLAGSPRIFAGMYAKFQEALETSSRFDRRVFGWATGVGRRWSREQRAAEPASRISQFSLWLAQTLVFRHVKRFLGGRLRCAVVAGTPLGSDVAEFFHAADVLLLQGLVVPEAGGLTHLNRMDCFEFGTLGPPLPGVEVEVAPGGELRLRSTMVALGRLEGGALRPVADAGGWVPTGLRGEVDAQGLLRHVADIAEAS